MKNSAEVIIIGGGIIGCATAYYLAKSGCSVIVLEKSSSIGDGGSSRNGGGVRQSGRDSRELPLAAYAIKNIWPTLSEELELDIEYCQAGNLRLGKTEEHLKILKELAKSANAFGIEVNMISGENVHRINPYLADEVIGASWCPTDGHANPLLTTLGYYRKARALGVCFMTNENVISIQKVKGRSKCVVTEQNIYESDSVVLAAGYASKKIGETIGISLPLIPELLECLVTEAETKMFSQMLGTAEADFYGHQSKHGSFVFGGSSGFEVYNGDKEKEYSSSITAACICRGIMKYIPKLSDIKIVRTWAGWMDRCADKVPIISGVEEVPGLAIACGFTGHGFGIAPAVGLMLAQIVRTGKSELDLCSLKYDRFRAKG